MQQYICVVRCDTTLHARPSGQIARAAKSYERTAITITKDGTTIKASQLIRLMSLSIRDGDTIVITADGPDEEEAIESIKNLFEGGLS